MALKMKKIILTEGQFKNLLKEELGVSEMVTKKTKEVFQMLVDNVKKTIVNSETYNGFNFFKGDFSFQFFETKVSLSYKGYNYLSKDLFSYSKVSSDGESAFLDKRIAFMWITVPCLSGTIVKGQVLDTIQHELEHLYQEMLIGKVFANTKKYGEMRSGLESTDEMKRNIAKVAYVCFKDEQDAFVNGLYAFLMSFAEPFFLDRMKESECWKVYFEAVSIYEKNKNEDYFIEGMKAYGMTMGKVRKCLSYFARKIGRVIMKVKKDKIEKQGWRK